MENRMICLNTVDLGSFSFRVTTLDKDRLGSFVEMLKRGKDWSDGIRLDEKQ